MRAGFSKQQPFFRVRQARGGTSQQEMRGLVLIHRNWGIRFTGRMSAFVDFALYAFDADLA